MLRESFDVEIEGERRLLGSPRVIKNDVGAANGGFFWVKERCGYLGPPSIFGFLLASAGCGVAILSLCLDV